MLSFLNLQPYKRSLTRGLHSIALPTTTMALFGAASKISSSSALSSVRQLAASKINSINPFVRQLSVTRSAALDNTDNKGQEECGRSKAVDQKAKILKEKTPQGKLEEGGGVKHPYQEQEPLPEHPGGVNPKTGEVGGPKGPEPTRYGDWERKGRVTDF